MIYASYHTLTLLILVPSVQTNKRTDGYAITPEGGELRLLRTLVEEVRKVVPKDFIVGVKLNAGDYTTANSDDPTLTPIEERALNHMKQIAQWGGVDFIEISGGDYVSVGTWSGSTHKFYSPLTTTLTSQNSLRQGRTMSRRPRNLSPHDKHSLPTSHPRLFPRSPPSLVHQLPLPYPSSC